MELEVGPQSHNRDGLLGPNSIMVVYMALREIKGRLKPLSPPMLPSTLAPKLTSKVKSGHLECLAMMAGRPTLHTDSNRKPLAQSLSFAGSTVCFRAQENVAEC